MEKLEIHLTPELVEKVDVVVELLGLSGREELVRCAIRRYVDEYFIVPKVQ
jgi:metal-responsive CopG/Arc/MetJ family transcriptional regulator